MSANFIDAQTMDISLDRLLELQKAASFCIKNISREKVFIENGGVNADLVDARVKKILKIATATLFRKPIGKIEHFYIFSLVSTYFFGFDDGFKDANKPRGIVTI